MHNKLKNISDTDRVWVFPSQNKLGLEVQNDVLASTFNFLAQWRAHGKALKSYTFFIEDQFLIISVDEAFEKASGCSIDALTHFVNKIEDEFGLGLSDRSLLYFKNNERKIEYIPFTRVKNSILNNDINEETIIINTSASNGAQLKNNWYMTVQETWLRKYFQKSSV